MIFRRQIKYNALKGQPMITPGNRAVNRVLTYGLVFFIIYAVYTRKEVLHSQDAVPAEVNYTAIDWRDYVIVSNMASGGDKLYKLSSNRRIVLDVTSDDVSALGNELKQNKSASLYSVSVPEPQVFNFCDAEGQF